MATLEELEKRIQVLEDLEAIKKLKARYAQLCDAKYRDGRPKGKEELELVAKELANLFTEDAVWDGGKEFGICKGRKEIYERFKKVSLNFAVHYFLMPHITIEGNKAWARWYLWQVATLTDNTPVWFAGLEDDEYVKINGQWLQTLMKATVIFLTPYDQGWVKKRIIG